MRQQAEDFVHWRKNNPVFAKLMSDSMPWLAKAADKIERDQLVSRATAERASVDVETRRAQSGPIEADGELLAGQGSRQKTQADQPERDCCNCLAVEHGDSRVRGTTSSGKAVIVRV